MSYDKYYNTSASKYACASSRRRTRAEHDKPISRVQKLLMGSVFIVLGKLIGNSRRLKSLPLDTRLAQNAAKPPYPIRARVARVMKPAPPNVVCISVRTGHTRAGKLCDLTNPRMEWLLCGCSWFGFNSKDNTSLLMRWYFLEDLSVIGGLLLVAALGGGRISLDRTLGLSQPKGPKNRRQKGSMEIGVVRAAESQAFLSASSGDDSDWEA